MRNLEHVGKEGTETDGASPYNEPSPTLLISFFMQSPVLPSPCPCRASCPSLACRLSLRLSRLPCLPMETAISVSDCRLKQGFLPCQVLARTAPRTGEHVLQTVSTGRPSRRLCARGRRQSGRWEGEKITSRSVTSSPTSVAAWRSWILSATDSGRRVSARERKKTAPSRRGTNGKRSGGGRLRCSGLATFHLDQPNPVAIQTVPSRARLPPP